MVTLVAMFLSKKAEAKLKATVEERELGNRDVALLVAMIAVLVSIIAFVPQMAIMALFLFSYTTLLFTVSYAFSDMEKRRLKLYCGAFVLVSGLAAVAAFFGVVPAGLRVYGTLAFIGLAAGSLVTLMYALRSDVKPKWYVAALSPALFLLLFVFYGETSIGFIVPSSVSFLQFPYLLNIYGLLFAVLIVAYLNSLFTWKTVFIFAALLTGLDIVLVWVTGQMVQAANAISGLGLPVLVAFPTLPIILTMKGILILRLGLGDLFFAGILATQTMKKFGKKIAVLSALTISISFGLFEMFLLNFPGIVSALPATLPIVLGWLPVVGWKIIDERRNKTAMTTATAELKKD
ncbi:MAG: hypothetical protein NWE99_08855 [Candidatus Bathyarchaeota archaeon]|nr:hypothetical protein [Candidatus Bathyarchaeota archaeon]